MSEAGAIVGEFLAETAESLDRLERDLVGLAADPSAPALLASAFRTLHTVKGTSGFLGFRQLECLSHETEGLLGALRDDRLPLTRERADALLEVVDAMRKLLVAIAATGQEDTPAPALAAPALAAARRRLSSIASALEADVTRTGMQPVEQLFAPLPRLVRDLAGQCGKHVRLELRGGDTELDRSLLEAVKAPLLHLVRNAVDHGIERPGRRRAAGKDPVGLLSVRAAHERGEALIEVSDDGAGIDPGLVGRLALERGLVDAGALASLPGRAVLELVFSPGLTTARSVTSLSGRGVGLDVVRTDVERIGGRVELDSAPGAGTRVRLRIPLGRGAQRPAGRPA